MSCAQQRIWNHHGSTPRRFISNYVACNNRKMKLITAIIFFSVTSLYSQDKMSQETTNDLQTRFEKTVKGFFTDLLFFNKNMEECKNDFMSCLKNKIELEFSSEEIDNLIENNINVNNPVLNELQLLEELNLIYIDKEYLLLKNLHRKISSEITPEMYSKINEIHSDYLQRIDEKSQLRKKQVEEDLELERAEKDSILNRINRIHNLKKETPNYIEILFSDREKFNELKELISPLNSIYEENKEKFINIEYEVFKTQLKAINFTLTSLVSLAIPRRIEEVSRVNELIKVILIQ